MTPEIIQLAAEKGAPAQSAAKAPTASLAQAAQQMQQNQHSQQAGPATTPAPTQAPRPPFKSSPAGNTDTPQGDENAQQPSPRPPFKANPQAGTDQANPPQSIAAEAVDDYLQAGQIQIPQKFQQLVNDHNIDIAKNFDEARRIPIWTWINNVKTYGDWDYKNNKNIKADIKSGKYPASLVEEFGNWHFGIAAKAKGFNMEQSMFGAGTNQVFRQGRGNPNEWAKAAHRLPITLFGNLLPDSITEKITRDGFSWGDNPGDAENIMEGWKFADDTF